MARALGIYRVSEVVLFPDPNLDKQEQELTFIRSVLEYLETPQHIRKHLIQLRLELKYAGILPPLQMPNHPNRRRLSELVNGEFREGVVVQRSQRHSDVDIGVERLLKLDEDVESRSRITVRCVRRNGDWMLRRVDPTRITLYWGFRVSVPNLPLGRLIKTRKDDLVIATSRYGRGVKESFRELQDKWQNAHSVLIAFGAPKAGLGEILATERLRPEDVAHFTLNTIPEQGTETVRTEEALFSTLAILNTL